MRSRLTYNALRCSKWNTIINRVIQHLDAINSKKRMQ